MALPQAKADALAARLAALAMPSGGWTRAAREAALARLSAMGLPARRDEYWRYTDPAALVAPEVPRAALFDAGGDAPFDSVPRVRLVFVDGVFDAAQSDDPAAAGIEITRLATAQGRDHERRAVTHLFARLGAGAQLKSFTLTKNGRLTRNETVVELAGAGGSAHVAGAAVGDGDFLQDDTVFVTHAAPGCESRQVYKKVLKNGATGVFQGKILVHPQAQKTDGYQISQSLLLDEASQFLAKPELEIYADDVKCSHGSTSGAIDPVALFYLRSRGVPEAQAKGLLVLAFLAEALEEIADERLAEDIRGRLEGWLARHDAG